MKVLEELLRVLSPKSSNKIIFATVASLDSKMLQLILFNTLMLQLILQKGRSSVCVGRTVEKVVGRSFDFITAEANRIEVFLKFMFKRVFPKIAQAQT